LCTLVIILRLILVRMRSVSKNVRKENENTHFVFSNCEVEKYGRARQATDGDRAHAHYMLDN